MKTWRLGVSVAALLAVALCGSLAHAGDLTFEQRVAAQAAIERVYYSHQTGATAPFEEAVPREVIEQKVRTYLEQSTALERFWHAPVTAEQLRRDMERQARESRMPGRLAELWAALGNDPFLVQECLARPALVDRLVRSFQAGGAEAGESPRPYDEWWSEVRGTLAAEGVGTAADLLAPLPPLAGVAASGSPDEPPCLPDDTWHNGSLDDLPDSRYGHSAVWTGSLMIVWGGILNENGNTGARYDPATSAWTPVTTVGAPSPRQDHTAVWTGGVMIVWGGKGLSSELNTGGRYNPTTDSWAPTSLTGAPAVRYVHSAVWTGSLMLVWGGRTSSSLLNSGGRYDPVGDTWSPISTLAAPTARAFHQAVWTGSLMVVWGGQVTNALDLTNTGGRYDPATNSWTATSTTGAPSARYVFSAVWTGSRMVIWGGYDGTVVNTGGRYDPVGNTWAATSASGAPLARRQHTAVWSGSQMIVWGGEDASYKTLNTGSRYDPVGNTWSATSTSGAPTARNRHSAVWTGSQMIVWGGSPSIEGSISNTGGRYDPLTDVWTPTNSWSAPVQREAHAAVWTGNMMLIWGGAQGTGSKALQDGGRYDPALDQWSPTTLTGAPEAREGTAAVWTGREMVVWGGIRNYPYPRVWYNTGGRYDPIADHWVPTSTTGAPSARERHVAVWTGSWMIVWGGKGDTADQNDGGRYDPIANTWSPVSTVDAPLARSAHSAVWADGRMVVWGGVNGTTSLGSGGRYDPDADSWTPMSMEEAPPARSAHTAVWNGNRMIVWGGIDGSSPLNSGGRYDPAADTWAATSTSGAPEARTGHAAVWGANRMIVWGGGGSNSSYLDFNTGGRYDPLSDSWLPTSVSGAPSARSGHSCVWTGTDAIVWGGRMKSTGIRNNGGIYALGQLTDGDGDSYSPCTGDCDDASAAAYPGAPELCDGLDNDCDSLVDDGIAAPSGVAGLAVAPVGDASRLSWPGLVSATAYDVVGGTLSVLGGTAGDFTPATDRCLANDLAVTALDDGATPSPANGLWYLVRAVNCVGSGTYDDGGAGQTGARDAEIGAAPGACP